MLGTARLVEQRLMTGSASPSLPLLELRRAQGKLGKA